MNVFYAPFYKVGKGGVKKIGYEENITMLMDMNVANRVRAEQVLEVMGNDLELAVEFLLAA